MINPQTHRKSFFEKNNSFQIPTSVVYGDYERHFWHIFLEKFQI